MLALLAVLAAGTIAVPGVLLVRLASAETALEVVPPPQQRFSLLVAGSGRDGRLEIGAGPFPAVRDARYGLVAVVGMNHPTTSYELELRNDAGNTLARCSFPAGSYEVERFGQSTLLACPVAAPEQLRTVVVRARAPDTATAIFASRGPDGRLVAGRLLAAEPRGLGPALDRLAVSRPVAFRGPTLLVALGLSTAALGAAALVLLAGTRVRYGGTTEAGAPADPPPVREAAAG